MTCQLFVQRTRGVEVDDKYEMSEASFYRGCPLKMHANVPRSLKKESTFWEDNLFINLIFANQVCQYVRRESVFLHPSCPQAIAGRRARGRTPQTQKVKSKTRTPATAPGSDEKSC